MPSARVFALLSVLAVIALPAQAQTAQAPQQPSFPANQVIACTPVLDGTVHADEWTPAYSIKTGVGEVNVSMSWDSQRIYFLLDGPKVTGAVLYIDALANGWLNGADNYEIDIVPSGDSAQVTAKLYNSFESSPSQALSPTILDTVTAAKVTDDRSVIEIGIARNDATGLVLKDGKTLAFGFSVALAGDTGKRFPPDPRAALQTVTLTDQMVASVKGLTLELPIKDRRTVPGQKLSADFTARNDGGEPITYDWFVVGGQGSATNLLNALRVRGDTLAPGKKLRQPYSSDLPETMPLGAYVLRGQMHLADGRTATVLSSFEMLHVVDATLDLGSGPVIPGQPRKITVFITNNRPRPSNGTIRIIAPEAIDRGLDRDRAKFFARVQESQVRADFTLNPPADTPPGEYDITAEVQAYGYTQTLKGKLLIGKAP